MITDDLHDSHAPSVDSSSHSEIQEDAQDALLQEKLEQKTAEQAEITREQLALGKRLLNWRTIVPLVVVIIALIFFARKANFDPKETWTVIKTANPIFYFAAFAIYYFSFIIRALRWRVLLENIGFTQENDIQLPRLWRLVEIIYISFFANSVVPAKLGELYRAYLLRQDIGVSGTRSFGTIVAERLLDLIVLLLMFIPAIIISLNERLPAQLQIGLEVALGLVIVGVIALFVLRQAREPIAKLVPHRFRGHYYHLQEGMLGSFRRLPVLTGLSIGVWLCEALRFYFIALALNLLSGGAIHVLTAAIFVGLGEALLTVVPATGGGVGIVEAGMFAMLALFGQSAASHNVTFAAILLDRTISYFSLLAIGFIVFLLAFGRQTTRESKRASAAKILTHS